MANAFIESLPKELPVDGITNHKTYRPPEHYHIVYKYETNVEGAVYVGSTNGSIRDRRGKNGRNYIGGGATKQETKFGEFIILNGWKSITSEKVIRIVREDCTPTVEQEEIDKNDAIALGFNSYRVVKETAEKPRTYSVIAGKGCAKNRPTEIGVENFQLTISHKDGSESLITMNKGFYRHYFEDIVLGLSTPGLEGHVTMSAATAKRFDGHRCVLTLLERDLGIKLRYGPDGCHTLTLDNLYITGTKVSLRFFLDQNPMYIKKVSYLTFGQWDTEEVEA